MRSQASAQMRFSSAEIDHAADRHNAGNILYSRARTLAGTTGRVRHAFETCSIGGLSPKTGDAVIGSDLP